MLYVAWQTWQDRDPVFFDEGTGESPFPLCSAVVGGTAVGVTDAVVVILMRFLERDGEIKAQIPLYS